MAGWKLASLCIILAALMLSDTVSAQTTSSSKECSNLCPKGDVCRCQVNENTGEIGCVSITHPCAGVHCEKPGHICRVNPRTKKGYCDTHPCYYVRCANCRYDEENDQHMCSALDRSKGLNTEAVAESQSRDPCDFIRCPRGSVCWRSRCLPLDVVISPRNQRVAKVESAPQQLGVPPLSCANVKCQFGYICKHNRLTGAPECVELTTLSHQQNEPEVETEGFLQPPGSSCNKLPCPFGHICQINRDTGFPECVPVTFLHNGPIGLEGDR